MNPAARAPRMGASQKSQSCSITKGNAKLFCSQWKTIHDTLESER